MKSLLAMLLTAVCLSSAFAQENWKQLFDGKTLQGWDGNPDFWRVEDGAITGQTTAEKPTKGNTFIVWRNGELDDFELKLEFRIEGGNSGIQFRSFDVPNQKWVIGGYQADFEAGDNWTGTCYGEKYRGVLAKRGQKTLIGEDGKPKVTGSAGDPKELGAVVKKGDWNAYHIIARGNKIRQSINGTLMCEVTDEDDAARRAGLLALQLHAGPPMKVQFKNIALKRLKLEDKKKVVFLAGNPSHGRGSHEHRAGCLLLARLLNENLGDKIHAVVYDHGWPRDPSALDNADAAVIFCDGGGGHLARRHLRQMDYFMDKGVGLGCIHYGVEIPKGEQGGDAFLEWIGGFFETHWSVNPHWVAKFDKFPDHPVSRGLKPFEINDEWYYHMRFREGMKGVTPILSALPPKETLKRRDGPHSGNPEVRKAVLERKEPQHVAWVSERDNNGRGFGFTGAHFHRNWANDSFRTMVLNAITWIAHVEVPEGGVPSKTPTKEEIEANQD